MSEKPLGVVDCQMALQSNAVTKTASFNGAGISMTGAGGAAGYAPGGGGNPVQAAVPISAADFTSGNEVYTFTLEQSDDGVSYAACGASVNAAAGDVGASIIIRGQVSKPYARYSLVISGTTPSITYGPIYLTPRSVG